MVKSEQVYSAQNYLLEVTGKAYCHRADCYDDAEFISEILDLNNLSEQLWDYPLSEINHIVEEQLDVVLVKLCKMDNKGNITESYRWYKVL